MQSSVPTASIVINELRSQKPTTLLLRTNRPYFYNSWAVNNRLRLKNEKLTKRQESSCCIAFYSFWLCVSAGIMIIVIYRFTDECSLTTNQKQFLTKCSRHWFFLAAICTSLLACCGVIFGACRYFRSQTLNFLYDDEHQTYVTNTDSLSPTTITSNPCCYPRLLINGASIIPSRQTHIRDDEHSNTTAATILTNASLRRKIPPFNYDELLPESIPILISKSPNMNNTNTNKAIFFSSSTSTLSSPQSLLSTTRSSNASNTITNHDKTKTTSIFENACTSGVDVWEKQQTLPSYR